MEIPEIIDIRYRGTLLSRIMSMPVRNPISFDEAVRMLNLKKREAFVSGNIGTGLGQYHWYESHFVEWISDQGYHIELTGDEFELYASTDEAA